MIKTNGLEIGYKKSLLNIDDLVLSSGQLYFLIGKNGSGKSTFLKTISGQTPILNGSIKLDNKGIETIHFSELPKTISFVSSHFPIVEFLRVEEYIALGRTFLNSSLFNNKNTDNELINSILLKLNINHLIGRFTSNLSDGEKQMVAIAKALAQETPIILLDEPTAFLDYSNKTLILDNLLSICREMNKCIILSSHDLDMILDRECSFLAVNSKQKKIQLLDHSSTKESLLEICFD